jgi:hypothetical protein
MEFRFENEYSLAFDSKTIFNWSRAFSGTRMSQNVPTCFPISFFSISEKGFQGLPVLATNLFIQWNFAILQKTVLKRMHGLFLLEKEN